MPTMQLTDGGGVAVNIGIEVQLPELELRTYGLFDQVVPRLSFEQAGADRIGFGAKWMERDPYDIMIDTIAGCSVDDSFSAEEVTLEENSTVAFSFADIISCSTIGGLDAAEINRRLDDDEDALRSFALASAATVAISGDHLNLAVNSTSVTGGDIVDTIGNIEQALGQRIANLRGHILVPLTLLGAAMQMSVVRQVGNTLLSPAGHKVIADAGHGPQNIVFGVGQMAWGMSPPIPVTGDGLWLDRSTNKLTGARQRYGIVVFNEQQAVRATVA